MLPDELWNILEAVEKMPKFHSIPELTKYIRSRSLLCAFDIDGWRMKTYYSVFSYHLIQTMKPQGISLRLLVYAMAKGGFIATVCSGIDWVISAGFAITEWWHSRYCTG